jgi:hypothetical protein
VKGLTWDARGQAWAWAFEALLPHSSKTVAFNLYHYEPAIHTDPQVRQAPSRPRSWANFSVLQRRSHINARANWHLLGQPGTLLARGARELGLR